MTSQLLIYTLSILLISSLISSCTAVGEQTSPSLPEHVQYTGALPSPDRIQANSAINASTMMPPTRP
ncbi:MAG: hypothetical protein JO149_07675 [Gammaproteobacteria bacterium]|nr:hypothetical protein [Gammaproteobacteria bacterium]